MISPAQSNLQEDWRITWHMRLSSMPRSTSSKNCLGSIPSLASLEIDPSFWSRNLGESASLRLRYSRDKEEERDG